MGNVAVLKDPSARKQHPYHELWYKNHYFCRSGSHLINKDEAVVDKSGGLLCPIHHKKVRAKRLRRREDRTHDERVRI